MQTFGSEFRYREAPVGPETLVVAISQSGETADTLGAMKAARAKGAPILAIPNVAYHVAVRRGYDVDQPRNLAKSVTVE